MRLLSIDPAKCSGWSVFNCNNECILEKYGLVNTTSIKYNNVGEELLAYKNYIIKLVKDYNIDFVVLEDYFFSSRFKSGSNLNPAFRSIIWLLCAELNIPFKIINISNWKKYIGGCIKPDKVTVRKFGRKLANKEYIKQALIDKYNLVLDNMVYDLVRDKLVPTKYDVCDSIAIGIYHLSTLSLTRITASSASSASSAESNASSASVNASSASVNASVICNYIYPHKHKNSNKRCTYPKKNGDFCGIHSKNKP